MRYIRTVAATLAFFLVLGACSSCSSDGSDGDTPEDPGQGGGPPPLGGIGTPPVEVPKALIVVGDSLSDVGNAAALSDYLLSLPVQPPTVGLCNPTDVLVLEVPCDDLFYRLSRVSDGPVAVEHLALNFDLDELAPSLHVLPNPPSRGTNYAVASAKARTDNEGDLSTQVDVLLLDYDLRLPEDALYVVMIGGNDAIDAIQAAVSNVPGAPATSAAIVTDAVAAIVENVERLIGFGARQLIVANVPDLATLPQVRAEARASGAENAVLAAASAISETFNRELDLALDALELRVQVLSGAPLELARFDLRAALDTALDAVAASGGNAVDACFDSAVYRQSSAAERVFHADCAPENGGAPRFATFGFWDGIHPTGAVHAALGAALVEAL